MNTEKSIIWVTHRRLVAGYIAVLILAALGGATSFYALTMVKTSMGLVSGILVLVIISAEAEAMLVVASLIR